MTSYFVSFFNDWKNENEYENVNYNYNVNVNSVFKICQNNAKFDQQAKTFDEKKTYKSYFDVLIIMFGKLKNILGIEGVKLTVVTPAAIREDSGKITGKIQLDSLSDQTISKIHIKLIEKYARGRKDNRLIDEYILGEEFLTDPIEIKKDETKTIPFEISFSMLNSEMDNMEDSNIFSKGLVKVAKYLKNVKSTFRLEATGTVAGTKLNPTSTQEIIIK